MNRHPVSAPATRAGGGAVGRPAPIRISVLIFLFAATQIVLFALAMLYVGHRSSKEADIQAYEHDLELFDNALNSRFALLARDQHSLASWHRYLGTLTGDRDRDRILDEMEDSLWYRFGHDRTLLIEADGRVLAYARDGFVERDPDAIVLDGDLRLLVDQALADYRASRAPAAGGAPDNVFATSFQNFEGMPAMLSAMPIGPDPAAGEEAAPPRLLISIKFIDGDLLEYLNGQLGFSALHFNANPPAGLPVTHRLMTTLSGSTIGAFLWRKQYPGARIWSVILPLVLILGALLALSAFVAARKLGGMTNIVEYSERRTHHMARHDPLTGLANRLRFGEELKLAIDGVRETPFAIIACDLDRFKAVNDRYGHAAGDQVIRDVAARMAETVGTAGLVSRTGGDEFIMLIHAFTDKPRLAALGKQLIAAVSAPIALDGGDVTDVGASLGIATAPACGDTAASLMRAADEALYEVKATGRGHVVFALDRRDRPVGS